ncbi:MAG: polyprenyl synthetase family protein [Bacillus sp. (in: firmicutes)]
MNENLRQQAETSYQFAEQRALVYFRKLNEQLQRKEFQGILTEDLQVWKRDHLRILPFYSFFNGRKKNNGVGLDRHRYIQWLQRKGKLERYLDRSISYIYMRDLGKDLQSPETKKRIGQVVDNLAKHLVGNKKGEQLFSNAKLYRWAEKEHVEPAFIWVIDKLNKISTHIPDGMDEDHARRKLIKIVAGVLLHEMEESKEEGLSGEERSKRLDNAIRLGYCYGLTYPFVDDLLDADVLSDIEKRRYSNLIREALITRTVPELGEWEGQNAGFISYVHTELTEAFQYIKANQPNDTIDHFFEQAYVFFASQEIDRNKDLSISDYSNEELYVPIILKSSSSRLIARSIISARQDEGFDRRTFYYGIYNQLADDFTDLFDDLQSGSVTPYTYYLTYHQTRPDLLNPFEMYWAVIFYLIHEVYSSDRKTSEVIFDRAINSLKRFRQKNGSDRYNQLMGLLAKGMPAFNETLQLMVKNADDVDFFDKLVRDEMVTMFRNQRQEREEYKQLSAAIRQKLNHSLALTETGVIPFLSGSVCEAVNYSLEGEGKRLRPIIAWMMGIKEFGLKEAELMPIMKSLEYMHTASLIFDDLPSQDNAPIRRGRATLHEKYSVAIGELSGLFLTQKAIEEQVSLGVYDLKAALDIIAYSASVTMEMCRGQAMDIESKGNPLTSEQLETMCFFKTGIAFEASLLMPAMVAKVPDKEKDALKRFARHAGIAFQIKDDLLDLEGDAELIGKPKGIDSLHCQSTFVTVLGTEEARRQMWKHYCQALEVADDMDMKTGFLQYLLDYIIHRNH